MTRLTLVIAVLFASLFVHSTTFSAPIDPTNGFLRNVSFDRSAGENGIYSAQLSWLMSGNRTTGTYHRFVSIALEVTEVYTPSAELNQGVADVYITDTLNAEFGQIFQNNKMYTFWRTYPASETVKAVMIAIKGQKGDAIFDNAWFDLANSCTVLAVIDDANDALSPYIYTKLACNMPQEQIDNAPEYLGDALLAITPLYTVNLPVIAN